MQPAFSSYLGYPRIHFAGYFRADSDTRNNGRCNYRPGVPVDPDANGDWGFNGTNEFQFFNASITAVVDSSGQLNTNDSIVDLPIVGNLKRPFAKLTDLDVDCQDHSTIYGMNFGIGLGDDFPMNESDTALYGNWTPSVIAQRMWPRLKCYSDTNNNSQLFQDSFPLGAQGTTFLTDLSWNSDMLNESPVLNALHGLASTKLSVRVSLYLYTRNYPPYVALNATLGYMYGVIGAPSPDDTLNVPGNRSMSNNGSIPSVTFDTTSDLCYGQNLSDYQPWSNEAPFEVDQDNMQVHVDLSNSLPSDIYNNIRYIGNLRLGVLMDAHTVEILGSSNIPYTVYNSFSLTSGIYDIDVNSSQMSDILIKPLVIVQVLSSSDDTPFSVKGTTQFSSGSSQSVIVLLIESDYFIRPKDYYVNRLDYMDQTSAKMQLYVTQYGSAVSNVSVSVTSYVSDPDIGTVLPVNGIYPVSPSLSTDQNGLVEFTFSINQTSTIPEDRVYSVPVCQNASSPDNNTVLPLDGQVYYFAFCLTSDLSNGLCTDGSITLSFLGFSNTTYSSSPTWVSDVEPILSQYRQVSKVMDSVLNLSSYANVTQYHNIKLMNLSLLIDFSDPGYMPTTRDLSPVRRKMILNWLKDPIYNGTSYTAPTYDIVCTQPNQTVSDNTSYPRCGGSSLPFNEGPGVRSAHFREVLNANAEGSSIRTRQARKELKKKRPLYGRLRRRNRNRRRRRKARRSQQSQQSVGVEEEDDTCTLPYLKIQLQTAVQLEWATIPTYMTSLYSIAEGCNTIIYSLIRSIIIQEMLHMTLAANILIAIGGTPIVDSADVAPSYPTNLPGGVLPNLTVTLEKLSIAHVHDVFMAIEVPSHTEVAGEIIANNTIGEFYDEIHDCIEVLGDGIFSGNSTGQVEWPWTMDNITGRIFPILDRDTAYAAIEEIKSQGEGADAVTPDQIATGTIAHFFKFEEVVCQNYLEDEGNGSYAYTGAAINFNADGVWPMRDNPSSCTVEPGNNCYIESKVFHQTYRAFLNKLQRVFSGHPDEITEAIEIMESLQVHAKKLMWTKYEPNSQYTCGPVFDYNWLEEDDPEC